jgi:ribosomal protein S17E
MTDNQCQLTDEFEKNLQIIKDEIYNNIEPNLTSNLEEIGTLLEKVAKNPILQSIYPWIGLHWLIYILGEVDHQKIKETVETLRQKYPTETPEQLSTRIIQQQGLEAAKIGLITNLIPPFAILLLGLEFSAITKLQVEMIYQLAAVHNLNLQTPLRRGENFALFEPPLAKAEWIPI